MFTPRECRTEEKKEHSVLLCCRKLGPVIAQVSNMTLIFGSRLADVFFKVCFMYWSSLATVNVAVMKNSPLTFLPISEIDLIGSFFW